MRLSQYVFKTLREAPKDEVAVNAQLLIRAGFVNKLHAGVYTYLPLGLQVLNNIEQIVREEMDAVGGQEMLMPALHPKEPWEKTKRWHTFDALFRLQSKGEAELALGPTHEEVLYPLLTHYVESYKDLPVALYQIQTKFRDETRAKSGLLRGREFRMKDLYSFHATDEDRDAYYEKVRVAYRKIFQRLGLETLETRASGGTFSEESLEFQVMSTAGEDTIFVCKLCKVATNKEVAGGEAPPCWRCGGNTGEARGIEVGNIFPLKDQYAKDFNLRFKSKDGLDTLVSAGCYGLGTSRVMGTIAEVSHDEQGIVWPEAVAPFRVHLIQIQNPKSKIQKYKSKSKMDAGKIYEKLTRESVEVLYDDREDVSIGEQFADADLIGIPWRVVVSEKSIGSGGVEVKRRAEKEGGVMSVERLIAKIKNQKSN